MAATATLPCLSAAPSLKKFEGLRATSTVSQVRVAPKSMKRTVGIRCDYIGSSTNIIVAGSTALFLFAGRFGLAPSANRVANAGLKLSDRETGLDTRDPAGFTGTDVLAFGTLGHIFGVGVVLGLKATGAL